ncbi:MAG: flhA, partial [Cyanobacteria bacterium RYN_339]|nr:flhA [Cyanobacteria bacterium RYN_339]
VTLSQWLGSALEATELEPSAQSENPENPALPILAVEIGRDLAPVVRRAFPERVATVRTRVAQDLGFFIPRVDLHVLGGLPPRGYRLSVRGVLMASGTLLPAEAVDTIALELDLAARTQAAALLTLDASQALLDELAVEHPVAVAQALDKIGLPVLHAVFLGLLREQVGLRDLAGLVDALVGLADTASSAPLLIEHVRRSLAPQIGQRVADVNGVITALELDANWDEDLATLPGGFYAASGERAISQDLQSACREAIARLVPAGHRPVLIVPRRFRPLVAEALVQVVPRLAVLAPDELAPRYEVRLVGRVERPSRIADDVGLLTMPDRIARPIV